MFAALPLQVSVVNGNDVVLPCGPAPPAELSQVTAVEWLWVNGTSAVTLHVLRHRQALVRDQAPEYSGRTAILRDGSLKLLRVRQQDAGVYKCVLLSWRLGSCGWNLQLTSFPLVLGASCSEVPL